MTPHMYISPIFPFSRHLLGIRRGRSRQNKTFQRRNSISLTVTPSIPSCPSVRPPQPTTVAPRRRCWPAARRLWQPSHVFFTWTPPAYRRSSPHSKFRTIIPLSGCPTSSRAIPKPGHCSITDALPDSGWSDLQIHRLLLELSVLDTNCEESVKCQSSTSDSFSHRWTGAGEREGRIYSPLVSQRRRQQPRQR